MYIDEKTAQLILDAIAWEIKDCEVTNETELLVTLARIDFMRFCKDRGIEGVIKE